MVDSQEAKIKTVVQDTAWGVLGHKQAFFGRDGPGRGAMGFDRRYYGISVLTDSYPLLQMAKLFVLVKAGLGVI